MESIVGVDFLAFPVSFDLVDEAMHFCLKIKLCLKTLKIIENLLIQLVYAFVWNISLCMKYQSTNTHISYIDSTIDFLCGSFPFFSHFFWFERKFSHVSYYLTFYHLSRNKKNLEQHYLSENSSKSGSRTAISYRPFGLLSPLLLQLLPLRSSDSAKQGL